MSGHLYRPTIEVFSESDYYRNPEGAIASYTKNGGVFQLQAIPDKQGKVDINISTTEPLIWRIWITSTGLQFYSPQIVGMLGGIKAKPGKCTVGFVEFSDITCLSVEDFADRAFKLPDRYALCFSTHTSSEVITTFLSFSLEEAPNTLPLVLDAFEAYLRATITQKDNCTVSNYKASILKELPSVPKYRLVVEKSTVSVVEEIVNTQLTDMNGYQETDVTISAGEIVIPDELKTVSNTKNESHKYCIACGIQLKPEDRFCMGCGAPQDYAITDAS